MRTSFAAMRIETVIFAIALSALFISLVGCGGANSETDPIGGVSLQTELDAYASDTQRILVYWSNNSDQSLTFGESWHLEKYNDSGGWESVASDKDAAFHDIGYLLEPGAVRKHVYWVKYIYDPLDEGLYRIATYYFDDSVFPVTPSDHRALYAEFTVSNDAAGLKKSELDYDDLDNSKDLTPHEMQQATSIRVYKNKKTYDTTLVIDGEKYAIAQGDGPWGVIQINWHEIDGREYLIYAYSREQNEKVARAAVFDIEAREEIFVSREFYGMDISIGTYPLPGTGFTIIRAAYWEDKSGGYSWERHEEIAALAYENGVFFIRDAV